MQEEREMNDPRGSLWRKWDLHVHTPSSIVQNYGGERAWGRFLDELEALPEEFKVIGINDYLFLDGYRRILEEKKKGRLEKIDLFLPVIELRLDKFGGSKGHLRKVNCHVIFSDELNPDIIEAQFLKALSSDYALTPEYTHISEEGRWAAVPDKESLTELGQLIIDSVPAEKRDDFDSPLTEGFNNLCVSLDAVLQALEKPYFRDRAITAVGKTEWASLEWNDHSIAEKKNIINRADLIFISSESPEHWAEAKTKLKDEGVNDLLLDCSDAHDFKDSSSKDRLGNCYTWVKADTTFRGLLQILNEPEERVFVGDDPPKDKHVRGNRTKYIDSIRIERKPSATLDETWFDNFIPLNAGLVAVIGNRGKGKSALTDTLGLLCNSRRHEDFTFLSPNAFCRPKNNKAKHFCAHLIWRDGSEVVRGLEESVDEAQPELAKYVPQNFLEKICTQLGQLEETDFDREIKKVIFSHVPHSDRMGKHTLDELIGFKTEEALAKAELIKHELHDLNLWIVDLEKKTKPEYREEIENHLKQKRNELKALEASKPREVPKPADTEADQAELSKTREALGNAKQALEDLDGKIGIAVARAAEVKRLVSLADKVLARLDNLEHQIRAAVKASTDELKALDLNSDHVLKVEIDRSPVLDRRQQLVDESGELDMKLDANIEGSLAQRRAATNNEYEALRNKLDEPNRLYQEYIAEFTEWEKRRSELVGSPETAGTIEYLEQKLSDLKGVPAELATARGERMAKALERFEIVEELADEYRLLYSPVHKAIEAKGQASRWLEASFDVNIVDTGFMEGFFDFISHGVAGSYCGFEEGRDRLKKTLEVQDLGNREGIQAFLKEICASLYTDKRNGEPVQVEQQLRKRRTAVDLFDYVFSLEYLSPRYSLRLAGKEMHELSPGERGTLLLVFYLLVDNSDTPLIIDQPEENLDNQTVYEVLVPSIQAARKERQIILVTHNPNLAVACDADQIIHADLGKAANYEMRYTAGAIENPVINKAIVDVLEGTKPAFDNRDSKYFESAD